MGNAFGGVWSRKKVGMFFFNKNTPTLQLIGKRLSLFCWVLLCWVCFTGFVFPPWPFF